MGVDHTCVGVSHTCVGMSHMYAGVSHMCVDISHVCGGVSFTCVGACRRQWRLWDLLKLRTGGCDASLGGVRTNPHPLGEQKALVITSHISSPHSVNLIPVEFEQKLKSNC